MINYYIGVCGWGGNDYSNRGRGVCPNYIGGGLWSLWTPKSDYVI